MTIDAVISMLMLVAISKLDLVSTSDRAL